ncbi:DUF6497 family protein [Roseovarius sp. S1116L3]|uniref:DUF6497 family protein n=1 Tax=Roseovarius roseus TaxID=3342636 RepID=UPI003727BCBD
MYAAPAAAENITLPSGLIAQLHEFIVEDQFKIRLRYVSEGFDPLGMDPEILLTDMTFLCENSDLMPITQPGGTVHVIVSIADQPAEFGVLNTDIRQSFDAFTMADGTCIWEAF